MAIRFQIGLVHGNFGQSATVFTVFCSERTCRENVTLTQMAFVTDEDGRVTVDTRELSRHLRASGWRVLVRVAGVLEAPGKEPDPAGPRCLCRKHVAEKEKQREEQKRAEEEVES